MASRARLLAVSGLIIALSIAGAALAVGFSPLGERAVLAQSAMLIVSDATSVLPDVSPTGLLSTSQH